MGLTFPYTLANGNTADADEVMANLNEIKNNFDTNTVDDASANTTEMQAATDPYPDSVESLATDLRGELKRLRYLIKQITGQAQWYIDPDGVMVDNASAQTIAGEKTFTDNLVISNNVPALLFTELDGSADNKNWNLVVNGERLFLQVVNDAKTASSNIFEVDRTGTTIDLFNILSTLLQHNGVKVPTISSTDTLSNKTFSDAIIASGGIQTDGTNTLKTKVIDIGDWDMDFALSVDVAHGLTLAKIRSITGIIRTDADDFYLPITTGQPLGTATVACAAVADATNIQLQREPGGMFDNANYDSTSFNRGWITITYIP